MGDADEGEVPAVNGETSPAPGETAEGKAAEDKDEAQADKEAQAETAKPADKKKDNTGAEQKKDGHAATKKPDAAPARITVRRTRSRRRAAAGSSTAHLPEV